MENYVCKIASIKDMNIKWDYEINQTTNKENWLMWKKENIHNQKLGYIIPYYGFLNGETICEGTAVINQSVVKNDADLVDFQTVYLSAFRTNSEYQNQGYFSALFKYMIEDLKDRGYNYATIGVEPQEEKNKLIYEHWGFKEFIKSDILTYPDGTKIEVLYYKKQL